MRIHSFIISNFRNYDKNTVNLSPGINIFIGSNGQGKTNILEGIYYLLHGKSYRVQRESELIRWGEISFKLYGEFSLVDRRIRIESHYQNKHKMIKVNDVPIRRLSEYIGTINAVSFSPDDLAMVKGGPAERRRFLDLHISQIRPGYISQLNSYNKALQQKNFLLKSNVSDQQKRTQITLWNEQIILFGQKIMVNRLELVQRLKKVSEQIYSSISSGNERIGMMYFSLGKNDSEQAILDFSKTLELKKEDEIKRQISLVGPHRDDLVIELDDKPARIYASQGQQRSIVLSLKLAEVELIKNQKGEYPLLLLDDVLSELDHLRRKYLLDFISSSQIQTLLTMTDGEILPQTATIFKVEKGQVRREC
ncbi:MAG: DNA replication/repair protein RecF [Desulfitobacteriaceae bacterium]